MPYCSSCGSNINSNVNFCPNCGAAINTSTNQSQTTYQNQNSDTAKTVATVASTAVGVSLLSRMLHRPRRHGMMPPPHRGPMGGPHHGPMGGPHHRGGRGPR